MSSRDRFEELATSSWHPAPETLIWDREQQMLNEQAMEQLMVAVRKAGDRDLTLEERKMALFMWLAGTDDAGLITLDKLMAPPSTAELRLTAGFRELDERGRGAMLGAIESIISRAPGQPSTLGRHNFFGRVTNVADTISNTYHNGKKQDDAS